MNARPFSVRDSLIESKKRLAFLFASVALTLPIFTTSPAQAVQPAQPPRWVLVDDLRVRAGPSLEQRAVGRLSRGAELILKSATEVDGFCLIEGDGQYGYVACKYLSAARIARTRAGEDGVSPEQRWVSGSALTLREAARPDAAVVTRLALNAIVKLLGAHADGGYCEVQTVGGQRGYTACRYLAVAPVVLAHIRDERRASGVASPDYDPERAFWLEPSWSALEQYAGHLKQRLPGIPPQGPWPRNEALERMKAHLALGLNGRKPEPFADWSELKRKAAQDLDLSEETRRLQAQGKNVAQEVALQEGRTQQTANELQSAIGIWGLLQSANSANERAPLVIRLVRALEFPSVRPSLFRNEREVASPNSSAEEASGRFGIVFRQIVAPRPKAGGDEGGGAGLYDMLARTQALVRPVQRVQLFRDGRFRVEASLIRQSETLWRDVDEPMCSGWSPGFGFGYADARIWRYFESDAANQVKLNGNPAGSLYAFYTNIELPRGPAIRTETPMKLDRDATGFARGTHLYYDLDGDGIPDLAVWEGQGKGPGHLEGPTSTDDRWYRLVLVNIDGAWKVLGSDVFGYGCGC
jgi:Bacterial SH3 domain